MKTTTTMFDIIQAELIKKGKNEFRNRGRLTFYADEYSFMKKVIVYDEDVQEIVDRVFFPSEVLDIKELDIKFKKTFVNRFLNREIGFQTVESFTSQLMYTLLINKDYIEMVYEHTKELIKNKQTSETKNNAEDSSDNRFLSTSLPQNQVNLNVDTTTLEYGDTNTISRTKNKNKGDSISTVETLTIDNLLKANGLLEQVFNDFDSKCFLQIW